MYLDRRKKAIDNGRNKKVPSRVTGVVVEDCVSRVSPPLVETTHGSQKALAENYRPPADFGGIRCYSCIRRESAERYGERSVNEAEGCLLCGCSVVLGLDFEDHTRDDRSGIVMMATIDMQKKRSRSPCVWGKSHYEA
jgi:hypothetical protein